MIECIRYTPVNKSTCLGVTTIRVHKWGVKISGISLHQKDGKRWVNFPARVVDLNGETKYYPYISFDERSHKDKFCEMVKQAIDVHAAAQAALPDQEQKETGECPF